jgi:hypothetical protein
MNCAPCLGFRNNRSPIRAIGGKLTRSRELSPNDHLMKSASFFAVLVMLAGVSVFSGAAVAQEAKPRPRGGFERPLAETPRFGNPGASPKLTSVEFRELLAHWEDFDTNKNQLLEKSEVPELFWKLFDQADLNHDGALDAQERALVMQQPAAPPASAGSPAASQTATTPSVSTPASGPTSTSTSTSVSAAAK